MPRISASPSCCCVTSRSTAGASPARSAMALPVRWVERWVRSPRAERPERLRIGGVVDLELVAPADHALAQPRKFRHLELAVLAAGQVDEIARPGIAQQV